MNMVSSRLSWADLADRPRTLDVDAIREAIEPLLVNLTPEDLQGQFNYSDFGDLLDRALVAQMGVWVSGWRWARSEGGPVGSGWGGRTSRTSIDGPAIAEWVLDAVGDWFSFLEETQKLFSQMPLRGENQRAADLERAAATILTLVVERTDADDAWYGTFHTVFDWFLESKGLEPRDYAETVEQLTRGRFKSWIAPDEATARQVCRSIGEAMVATPEPTSVDSTEIWLKLRASEDWNHLPEAMQLRDAPRDGHREFIDRRDAPRDLERAARLHRALDAGRTWASAGLPLSLDVLSKWAAIISGRESEALRTTDAFAKGGRERYGYLLLQERLESCLAEASDLSRPLLVRATLAYLDVCFFHPFADGNGRLARVVLDALLWREGLALYTVEPLFILSRGADHPRGAWLFAYMLAKLMVPRQGL